MKERKEEYVSFSRRSMLKESAIFLAGGIAGGIATACSTTAPSTPAQAATAPDAPPLPWKWVKIDPLEAGRRAYRGYHEYQG